MRPVSEASSRVTGKSFSKKYIALGRVVSHWEDIAGKDLAGKARPAGLRYRRMKNGQAAPEVTLEIATSSAHATALHYQKDLILERINQIFGERWITAIRFVSSAANIKEPKIKPAPIPISPEEQMKLKTLVQGVEDDDMKSKLEKLGEAVIRECN